MDEKENGQSLPEKEAQDGGMTSRLPLHDVINRTQTSIPVPVSRCKIPVPHKIKSSALKPPAIYKGTAIQAKKGAKDSGISTSKKPEIRKPVLRKSLLCRRSSPKKTVQSVDGNDSSDRAVSKSKEASGWSLETNKVLPPDMVSESLPVQRLMEATPLDLTHPRNIEQERTLLKETSLPSVPTHVQTLPQVVQLPQACQSQPPSESLHQISDQNMLPPRSAFGQVDSVSKSAGTKPLCIVPSSFEKRSAFCRIDPLFKAATPGTMPLANVPSCDKNGIPPRSAFRQLDSVLKSVEPESRPLAIVPYSNEDGLPQRFAFPRLDSFGKSAVPVIRPLASSVPSLLTDPPQNDSTTLEQSTPELSSLNPGPPARSAGIETGLSLKSPSSMYVELGGRPSSLFQSVHGVCPALPTLPALQTAPVVMISESPINELTSQSVNQDKKSSTFPTSSTIPAKEVEQELQDLSSHHLTVQSPPKQRSTTPDNLLFSTSATLWRESSFFPMIQPAAELPLYQSDCTPTTGGQPSETDRVQSPENTQGIDAELGNLDSHNSVPLLPKTSKQILKPPTLILKEATSDLPTPIAEPLQDSIPENVRPNSQSEDPFALPDPKPNPFVMSLPVAMSAHQLSSCDISECCTVPSISQANLAPDSSDCICTCIEKLKGNGHLVIANQEYEMVNHRAEVARRSMLQLEMLYETTWTELMSATTQVSHLAGQVAATQKEKSQLIEELEELMVRLEGYEVDRQMGFAELQCLTTALNKETERVNELVRQEKSLKELLDESHQKYELLVSDLEVTIHKQQASIDYRTRELEEQKTTIETLSSQLEQMEIIRENMEFLEAEHSTLMDSHRDVVTRLQHTETELATCKTVLLEKDSLCTQLQDRLTVLEESLELMEEDLERTVATVRVLKHENEEIDHCRASVHGLSHELREFLKNLLSKAGMKVSIDVRDFGKKVGQPWMQSLVASVLQAVGSPDEELTSKGDNPSIGDNQSMSTEDAAVEPVSIVYRSEEHVNSNSAPLSSCSVRPDFVTSPATKSRQDLGSSGSCSAFKPITSRTKDCAVADKANRVSSQDTKPVTEVASSSVCDENPAVLSVEVSHLSVILREIVRISQVLEKAAYLSIQDLQHEKHSLRADNDQLEVESHTQKEELEKLQSDLKGCRCKIQDLETEKQILIQQQQQLLEKLDAKVSECAVVNSVAAVENRFYKDSLQLQKRIYILKEQLSRKDTEIEELNEKASRRMKVLADNWSKADREVHDLDKLLETTRQVLHKNKSVFRNSEPLKDLLKELDGVCDGEEPIKPLAPIKTVAW